MCYPIRSRRPAGLLRYITLSVLFGLVFGVCADTSVTAGPTSPAGKDSARTKGSPESASACPAEPREDALREQDIAASPSDYWRLPDNESSDRCFSSLQTVRKAWLNNRVKIVDVRSPAAYRQVHIPGAVNLPEYAIRTKPYLKSENLVLINDGLSYDGLIQTCLRLKKLGYRNVSVLAGGIQAWFAKKDAVVFDQWHYSPNNQISPRELVGSQRKQPWLFLTDVEDIRSVQQLLQSEHVVPLGTRPHALRTRLKKIQENSRSRAPVNIVIITKSGRNPGPYRDGSALGVSNPAFFLKGGLHGYKQYIANHELQLARNERGPVIHRECGS